MSSAASAEDVKIGVILGFTGPIESLTPGMGASGELAMKEVSDSGKFLGGSTVTPVRGDSTCVDSAAASAAAERLITSDKVSAIFRCRLFRCYRRHPSERCPSERHRHDLAICNITGPFGRRR
jgi:ABC-type branched-subunit amino acid transport system substrate-binding protein